MRKSEKKMNLLFARDEFSSPGKYKIKKSAKVKFVIDLLLLYIIKMYNIEFQLQQQSQNFNQRLNDVISIFFLLLNVVEQGTIKLYQKKF